jgi:hypothetical protein
MKKGWLSFFSLDYVPFKLLTPCFPPLVVFLSPLFPLTQMEVPFFFEQKNKAKGSLSLNLLYL